MIRRLRVKFICINMLIVLILLAVMMTLVLSLTEAQMRLETVQMMRNAAAGPMAPFRPDDRSEDVRRPVFRLILSEEGELLSCEGDSYDLSDQEFLMQLVDAVHAGEKETGVLKTWNLAYLVHEHPDGEVIVCADNTGEMNAMRHLTRACLLIGLAGSVLFFGVSILLARWAVRPVEKAWEQQRQFVSDASHELKTPLTVILTDTELLQSGQLDEETGRRFLSSIRTMGERMRDLVEELLTLTRADRRMSPALTETVNWSACVAEAVLPFEPLFYEQGLSLRQDLAEDILVKGDAGELRRLAEILLDNARKYSHPDTETLIRLSRQRHSAQLTVENRGDEIPEEELEHIFLRFYRGDKARSMNGSYGLGLAIAKQIAENHRGKIWAESSGGRNRFHVSLPAVQN